jgi:hypothetical protein
MPTGYTSQIADDISFRKFALSCARNFGAAIALRDENSEVLPDPENVKFNGGNYHENEFSQAIANKEKLLSLSQDELEKQYQDWREKTIIKAKNSIKERQELRAKYERMLSHVKNWFPPTKEHDNMKNFMIEQITSSIEWDCDEEFHLKSIREAENSHRASYFWDKIEELDRSIKYHSERSGEDGNKDNQRSQWIKDLIDSLPKD